MRIVVVGAGLMGSQIGCEFALGEHDVTFLVRNAEAASERVNRGFALVEELGLAPHMSVEDARSKVHFATSAAELAAPELFLESIPEDFDLKVSVLAPIAQRFDAAIIGSNTSSIPLTRLGEGIGAAERTVGIHYWNPPLLMPPVEVIAGAETDPAVVARVAKLVAGVGKEPVLVEKDVPGFVWNRLQMALLREALWLVEEGVASPRAVDAVMRSGLARRYRYTGTFETIALGGMGAWSSSAANIVPELSNRRELDPFDRWLYPTDDELEAVRRRRDQGLANELRRERAGG